MIWNEHVAARSRELVYIYTLRARTVSTFYFYDEKYLVSFAGYFFRNDPAQNGSANLNKKIGGELFKSSRQRMFDFERAEQNWTQGNNL